MKYQWSMFHPHVPDRYRLFEELSSTLDSRWIGQGPKVDQFETEFSKHFSTAFPVAVSSGTAALHLAYRLLGLGSGDKVVSQVLTCTATHHALLYQGCEILFADIKPKTLTIDPEHVARLCNENYPQIKAIVGVHLGGLPCDIAELKEIASEYQIPLIFDAAQALGARYDDQSITSLSNSADATCISFQAIKQITTGDGGMLCVSSPEHRERARRLRWFSIDRVKRAKQHNWKPWNGRMITVDQDELGYKYQMSDIEACFGLAALKEVDEWLDHRHRLARRYRANLAGVAGLAVVETDSPRKRSSHSLFGILVEERDNFCSALESRGVETNVVQLRNDIYTVFGGQRQALPGMNEVEPRYLYLPIHGQLTLEDVDEICHHIGEGW